MRRDVLPRESPLDANEWAKCLPGSTNAEGDDASGEVDLCVATLCGANERASSGFVRAVRGRVHQRRRRHPRRTGVLQCGENQRAPWNGCVACPNGETRSAGDPVPGLDTTCSAFACAANERVFNQACIACPMKTNYWDHASGKFIGTVPAWRTAT